MDFKPIELEDIDKMRDFLVSQDYKICDFSPFVLYMWRNFFKTEYAIENETLYLKYFDNIPRVPGFSWPICLQGCSAEKMENALANLRKYAAADEDCKDGRLAIANTPALCIDFVREKYDGCEIVTNRDWADYLYSYDEIHDLAGRKFSSKRNHIKNFEKNYPDNRMEEITEENLGAVVSFYEDLLEKERAFFKEAGIDVDETSMELSEEVQTLEMLKTLPKLSVKGAVLMAGDKIAGFTVGDVVNETLIVHIEKADVSFKGVYAKLFHEFVLMNEGMGVKYINREEDVGDLGLRKSKLSYHPIELLDKYLVVFPKA